MTKKLMPVLTALSLALPGPGRAQTKVGFINTMTGAEAPIGENLTNGVDMALEDLGKKGVKITLVKQDDTGKPDKAMGAMEQLATGDEVAALVGPYTSANANAVAKLAEQYKVPQVIPAAAKEEITKQGYKYVFRLNAPAHQYAQSLLDAALAFGKPKSVAFIYESTDFGREGHLHQRLLRHPVDPRELPRRHRVRQPLQGEVRQEAHLPCRLRLRRHDDRRRGRRQGRRQPREDPRRARPGLLDRHHGRREVPGLGGLHEPEHARHARRPVPGWRVGDRVPPEGREEEARLPVPRVEVGARPTMA